MSLQRVIIRIATVMKVIVHPKSFYHSFVSTTDRIFVFTISSFLLFKYRIITCTSLRETYLDWQMKYLYNLEYFYLVPHIYVAFERKKLAVSPFLCLRAKTGNWM